MNIFFSVFLLQLAATKESFSKVDFRNRDKLMLGTVLDISQILMQSSRW